MVSSVRSIVAKMIFAHHKRSLVTNPNKKEYKFNNINYPLYSINRLSIRYKGYSDSNEFFLDLFIF